MSNKKKKKKKKKTPIELHKLMHKKVHDTQKSQTRIPKRARNYLPRSHQPGHQDQELRSVS